MLTILWLYINHPMAENQPHGGHDFRCEQTRIGPANNGRDYRHAPCPRKVSLNETRNVRFANPLGVKGTWNTALAPTVQRGAHIVCASYADAARNGSFPPAASDASSGLHGSSGNAGHN